MRTDGRGADPDQDSTSLQFSQPELRILRRLASGATYRTIATELYLSPDTVRYYAGRLQHRLGVANNVALVAAAVIGGLLSADVWPPQLTGVTQIDPTLLRP